MKRAEAIRIGKLAAKRTSLQMIQDRDLLIAALESAPPPEITVIRPGCSCAICEHLRWYNGPRAAALLKVKS